ncbi:MAG: hypothetical protein HFJ51_06865 [Clostridia bacterium]|nr:hypothetical protein [Clostridia bacterium]
MEKELEEFKLEVLTQLAVINSKLDGYGEIKKTVYETETTSKENKDDIKELQDKFKWLSRTTAGAIITGIVGIVFIFIKIGMGVG